MTKKGILKHREVFNAWLDGKNIQYFNIHIKQWVDNNSPNWLEDVEYRVKPDDWRLNFEDLEGFEVGIDGELLNFKDLLNETQEKCLNGFRNGDYMSILPTKEEADAYRVLPTLLYWRDKYNEGWRPDWKDNFENKYIICVFKDKVARSSFSCSKELLVFKSEKIRDKFKEDFKDLLEIAKPLL